jgi:molybdopterin-synthase adenylyltransferase
MMSEVEKQEGERSNRYSRQTAFLGMGESGQKRLRTATVAVMGCGGLGSAAVNMLARSGVGRVVVVDRDRVELSNLQRQVMFDEADALAKVPKVIAAVRAVERVNSEVRVCPLVAEVSPANIEGIIGEADVVIDGTDNFETRYLLNDACVKLGIPWVYGGAIGVAGMTTTILPGETSCLRCLFPDPPPSGTVATSETAGILASTVMTVSSIQWTEAIKILVGDNEHINRDLLAFDLWTNDFVHMVLPPKRPDCICCGQRRFEYLEGRKAIEASLQGEKSRKGNKRTGICAMSRH